MNEVIKRLRRLSKNLKRMKCFDHIEQLDKDIDEIEKIFDKDTPKKVVKLSDIEYGYTHECPVCHQYVGTICESEESIYVEENDYCCECGQKLDWSDEDVD